MKLIIVRHGETEENKAGILQGHMPGTLSHEGTNQGKKLANRLKDENIDAIYSSDLKRAVDTAKLIGEYHPKVEIEYTKQLRENDYGSWTGRPSKCQDWNNRPNDLETVEKMKIRAKELLDQLYKKYSGKAVLLISHGTFIRVLITQIADVQDPFADVPEQHNTAVSIFEIYEDRSHKIHCLNCTKHLK